MSRRGFAAQFMAGAAVLTTGALASQVLAASTPRSRKMTMDLVCGSIGVSANQREAIELAARHGFESVGADGNFLAKLSERELDELRASMQEKKVVWGAAGLTVEFRQDETKFADSLKLLPQIAAGLKRAGVNRVSTWITPAHAEMSYLQNFRLHARRLRQCAQILGEQGLRLGLEYVGPKTSWTSRKFPFIHTLAETRDLITEIGTGNVGYVLDCWHWWHAGDTVEDILALKQEMVVAVDVNDAPADVPKEQQPDGKRELPCATGVIDIGAFLNVVNQIGYDGPVRAEPFNQALRKLPREEACAATAKAVKAAFALIR